MEFNAMVSGVSNWVLTSCQPKQIQTSTVEKKVKNILINQLQSIHVKNLLIPKFTPKPYVILCEITTTQFRLPV